MNEYLGKICPFCKAGFTQADEIVVCSSCDMPHHKDCWVENQGCTTFGCMGSIKAVDSAASTVTARQLIYEDVPALGQHVFCTRCGAKTNSSASFCDKCGRPLNGAAPVTRPAPPAQPAYFPSYGQYTASQTEQFAPGYGAGKASEALDDGIVQLIGQKSEYYVPKFQELRKENKKISWNWAAFLVTPYWLIYRKMYGYGAAVLGGAFILTLFGSTFLSLAAFAGYIAFGLFANYIYMDHLEKKALQLDGMTEPYRSQFVMKSGGVDTMATVLTAVGYGVLVLFLSA